MDNEKIAKELVRVARDLVGYDNEYEIDDREFTQVAVQAIKNLGGRVTSKGGAHSSVHGKLPFIEADNTYQSPLSIMFLYKHYLPGRSGEVNVTFGIYTQMNNKRNNVYKEFSTYGGDSQEKAFKRFQRFCKDSLPKHFAKLESYGAIVPE